MEASCRTLAGTLFVLLIGYPALPRWAIICRRRWRLGDHGQPRRLRGGADAHATWGGRDVFCRRRRRMRAVTNHTDSIAGPSWMKKGPKNLLVTGTTLLPAGDDHGDVFPLVCLSILFGYGADEQVLIGGMDDT